MKVISFIIFFSVFFSIYGSVNYYIYMRGLQSIPWHATSQVLYKWTFLFLSLSFFIGRISEKVDLNPVTSSLVWIGSYWFAYILYFFISIICLDLLRILNNYFSLTGHLPIPYETTKRIIAFTLLCAVTLAVIVGSRQANNPIINSQAISIAKSAGTINSLSIVFISDIHMGTIVKNSKLTRLISMIDSIQPDIVLIGGDLVDEDLGPVIKNNLGDCIKEIKSKYGTYGVTGNHEYIGGVEEAVTYLKNHGITIIRDSVIEIDSSFYIVGREDYSRYRMSGTHRKDLQAIMKNIDPKKPVIVLDHQPNAILEAEKAGADLILSGHTHAGQLWPISYITNAIFENGLGYKNFSSIQSFVSSGYGTWGPPVRLGNKPEIVHLTISFKSR